MTPYGPVGGKVATTTEDADALKKTARTFPMTDFYDVEETITSLGIGEALVTVLSPRGVPSPLAATRLLAPDSLMAALAPAELQGRIATSMLFSKYGPTVDRDSAAERLAADRAAAQAAAPGPAGAPGPIGGPGTSGGMTPAQYQREIDRQVREQRAEERAAERERKAEAADKKRDERARQRSVDNAIRTGGRVVTSRVGQSLLKGIFGAIFGRKR